VAYVGAIENMNTQNIMQTALDLSGMDTVPPDSAILAPASDITRTLMSIDICEDDLCRAKDEGYDLVIAHHPFDRIGVHQMLARHKDLMLQAGVPAGLATTATEQIMENYRDRTGGQLEDGGTKRMAVRAHELGIGLMNIHTPCDELGRAELQRVADGCGQSASVSELMNCYKAIPEIAGSDEHVELVCGSDDAPTGRTVVMHGAGTNGGHPVAAALFESGIDTVVYIHLYPQEQRRQVVQESKGNLILTGHYGSDSLGINPLLDALEEHGVETTCFGNMIRIKR
jgi:putative NIF3 family GTP cyclohydrolase 1 type 2